MAVAPHEPGDVRYDEPDEANHAGNRDGRGREQRGREVYAPLHCLDVSAQVAGRLFAERQEVEWARSREHHGQRDGGVHGQQQHGIPGRCRQSAPQPQKRVAQLRGIRQRDDGRRDRGGECADRYTAEQQNPRIERRAAHESHPIDEAERGERTGERRQRQHPGPRQMQRKRDHCAESRSA